MKKNTTKKMFWISLIAITVIGSALLISNSYLGASSHREAPLIANDPLADNTDLYAFRSPDDTNSVTIIACYVPAELPQGGPNYYSFGPNVRYEVHINNGTSMTSDQIIYRFTFAQTNEDNNNLRSDLYIRQHCLGLRADTATEMTFSYA